MKENQPLFILCLLFLFARDVFAGIITVAPSGGDYNTIQAGINAALAGDTVLVLAGIYNEAVFFPNSGSASGGPITLSGEPGSIIDGAGKSQPGISISGKNYIRVIGLELRNFTGNGTPIGISIEGSSSFLEISGNKVHNIEKPNGDAHGIAFYGNSSSPISNIVVKGNEVFNCQLGSSESLVLNGNVSGFEVSGNIIHDNDNIGIDFIGFEGVGPVGSDQARNGVCFNNTVFNISSANNPAYGGDRAADGIYVDGGKNIIIEKNTVYSCDIGIELASEHLGKNTQDILVRNNFVSGSFQANIMAGGYAANKGNAVNITIVNNTTYQGNDGELALQFNCSNIVVKNNIFYGNSNQAYLQEWGTNNSGINVNNNLYFGQSSSSPGDWADAGALFLNPLLVSPFSDLHLGPQSPAINAGISLGNDGNGNPLSGTQDVDGQIRVQNGNIDIGADEFEAPCTDTSSSFLSEVACDSFILNGISYSSSGIYTQTLVNASGCDSLITLNLTIEPVDVSVVNNSPVLVANNAGAIYQWVDCGNGFTAIPNATNQSFTAASSGNYAVVISDNGCIDTSACFYVSITGIAEGQEGTALRIIPDPSTGNMQVELGKEYSRVSVAVSNVLGQNQSTGIFCNARKIPVYFPSASGIYFVEISSQGKVIGFVKGFKQ